jgi:hypothetical protein
LKILSVKVGGYGGGNWARYCVWSGEELVFDAFERRDVWGGLEVRYRLTLPSSLLLSSTLSSSLQSGLALINLYIFDH